jgi:hypothetical protein
LYKVLRISFFGLRLMSGKVALSLRSWHA